MKVFFSFVVVLALVPGANAGINPNSPGLPVGLSRASALCVDCHTVNPKVNSGTHFVVFSTGTLVRNTNNIALETLAQWPASSGYSKYGVVVPGALPTSDTTAAQGEMLCESCHNLVKNVSGGNNLLAAFGKTSTDGLCIGCHSLQSGGPPNHHPMTGQNVGPDDDLQESHVLDTGHGSHVKSTPTPGGTDAFYPAEDQMSCASCHSPHGAAEAGGARSLRRGYSASAAYPGATLNLITTSNVPATGDVAGGIKIWNTESGVPGIDRQYDITATFGPSYRLVSNADPLCDACHAP